jgi:predicted PurR-regulated permease PerM
MTMFSSSSSTKRSTLAFFAMLFFICIASFASAARISPAMNTNTNNIPSADSNGLIPRNRIPAPAETTGPASARLGASGNWFVHSSVRSFLVLYSFSSLCFSLFFFFFFFFFRDDDVLMRAVEKQQHPKPHTDPDEDRTPNNHNHNNNNQTRN